MNKYFEAMDIHLTKVQKDQFDRYFELLISENEKYNLTGIVEYDEVYVKHFLDSVLIEKLGFDLQDKKMIDIGTGAGFPAIPIKIMNPSVQMTCLDALNKRIGFIQMVNSALEIDHMELVHGRAEDFGQNPVYREKYDFAVSRAVAELRLLLEFVMPFVKVNGYFIAYKSLKSKSELDDAKNALKLLNSELVEVKQFILPDQYGERDMLIIRKNGNLSKKYPRKPGVPKKSPL
ncbi:MAG: 16S rRNA (guanine(527)-N(7))-methyltransferase RsmG [Clostridiales bacterium]|nr:16S rRNA (guanine(527)-N(7))-methyltransferase RsmG [Clostridiales bacterium]